MGKLNMGAMKSKLEQENSNRGSGANFAKLENGKNIVRVLPPKGERDSFYEEGYMHFSLGDDGRQVATCPKTFDKNAHCPICEYVDELRLSKNKSDKELADKISSRRRIYINALMRDDEEETPKVLPIGVTILKGILEAICDPDYGDITDPEDGRDITINRKGQGLNTEYSVLPKPNTSVVSDEYTIDELEEEMADLDKLFKEVDEDQLLDLIGQGSDVDDDEDYDDDNEDEEEEEEEGTYDDMELVELKKLCKARGIPLPAKVSRLKLITLLEADDADTDAGVDDDDEDEDEPPFDADDAKDEIEDEIAAALKKRKARNKK